MAATPAPDRIDAAIGRAANRRLTAEDLQAGTRQLATRDRDLARIVGDMAARRCSAVARDSRASCASSSSSRSRSQRRGRCTGGSYRARRRHRTAYGAGSGPAACAQFGLTRQKAGYCTASRNACWTADRPRRSGAKRRRHGARNAARGSRRRPVDGRHLFPDGAAPPGRLAARRPRARHCNARGEATRQRAVARSRSRSRHAGRRGGRLPPAYSGCITLRGER